MKRLIYSAVIAAALVALVAPPVWAADSDEKFKIHGEIRMRGNYMDNWSDFNSDSSSDDQALFWPSRARLAFEGQFTKNVSAYFEIQHGYVWGGTGNGQNGNTPPGYVRYGSVQDTGQGMELYQASVTLDELWSDSFSLTFGRQELSLGNELLLGDNDFYMGFTHDGITGRWDFDKVDVTVWYFREAEGSVSSGTAAWVPPSFTIPGSVFGGYDFLGGYATWTFKSDMLLDFYWMYQDIRTDGTSGGVPWINDISTIGIRFAKDRMGEKGFLWNIEWAQQFGSAQTVPAVPGMRTYDNDISGSIWEGMLGYNFHRGDNDHRVYARYVGVSGDDTSAGNTEYEGFIGVAGDFHGRLGKGDFFLPDTGVAQGGLEGSSRGIDAWTVGYNGFFNDKHEFGIAYWDYAANEMAGSAANTSDDLGDAWDLWYGFNYTRNVSFEFDYSQLNPGDYLLAGGSGPVPANTPDDSATRIYGQVRLRF